MSTSTTKPGLSVKLLIDKKENRVLFAEASKDFVDFLFSLISLPIGTVIRLLSPDETVGCLGKLYQSLENLSDTYLQADATKTALLKPNAAAALGGAGAAQLFALCDGDAGAKPLYQCGNCRRYVTYDPKAKCSNCSRTTWERASFVQPTASEEGSVGFVKDVVTYLVMDDLEVKPMSSISIIALIKKYDIREIGDLEETVVTVGMDEGLKLLKALFESKTVLSDIFLGRGSSRDVAIAI